MQTTETATVTDRPSLGAEIVQYQAMFSAELVELLERSFPAGDPPSSGSLVHPRSPGGWDEVAEYVGIRWTDVPPEVLGFNADALHFMSADALLYYLPAFLRKCVNDYPNADCVPDQVLRMLTPGEGDPEEFETITTRLSRGQRQAIREFLIYALANFDKHTTQAQAALEAYWAAIQSVP